MTSSERRIRRELVRIAVERSPKADGVSRCARGGFACEFGTLRAPISETGGTRSATMKLACRNRCDAPDGDIRMVVSWYFRSV